MCPSRNKLLLRKDGEGERTEEVKLIFLKTTEQNHHRAFIKYKFPGLTPESSLDLEYGAMPVG